MTQVINEDTGRLAIACTKCSEVIDDLSQVIDRNGEEFCKECDRKLTVIEWVQKVNAAAIQVNTESQFCAFLEYSGHVHGLSVYLTPSKENYHQHIASSNVYLNLECAPAQLERIHHVLTEIAIFNQLPDKFQPSKYGMTPEVMSA